ncbi:MAG: DUF1800 domain-containing protein [Pyrinomonadaceae bacterium]
MFSLRRGPVKFFWLATVIFAVSPLSVFAQGDPNPNSPTPIIVSIEGSPRLLAYQALRSRNHTLGRLPAETLRPGGNAVMFVANLSLMEGEDANAFRIFARDEKGRTYKFPVIDLRPAPGQPEVYALTFRLQDEVGYWQEPIEIGDLIVRLSWRGLSSNELLLGYGGKGGKLSEEKSLKSSSLSDIKGGKVSQAASLNNVGIGYKWSGDRVRFLEQATFGPTPSLDLRIRRIGLRVWVAEQFEKPYPSPAYPYPDIPLKNTNRDDITTGCGPFADTAVYRACIRNHYTMYPLQNWFFQEALYGDAQLRHRVAWALGQIWVTSGVVNEQSSWMIAYHKVLSKNAFGNYRDLMEEMTLNPGMGNYLDMVRSTRNNPNENYPREILQLFSVGLFELNQDGTLKLNNGNPIETYSQTDVNNFTKVFTGWNFCNTGCPSSGPGLVNFKDPIVINAGITTLGNNRHDLTAKTLFSYPGAPNPTIAACTGTCDDTLVSIASYANTSLDQTLDNIFNHPNVGPFVSKTLIQHLVTSDPSPAYVSRVAGIFNNNGFGVRGDLKAVVKAIILDPEARGDVKTDPNFGKLREPVQLMTNLFRQVGVTGANFTGLSDGVIVGRTSPLGQNVFYSPTVFNYYPPDYVIPGTSLLGPEFALMTSGTAVSRLNFTNTVVMNDNAVGINAETSPNGTSLDIRELEGIAAADTTSNRLLDTLNNRFLHGTMTPATRSSILTAVNAIAANNPRQRARQAVYLVATSSQFQVQR